MLRQDRGINLRRNGKQQACEPCRELKIACDHTRPHCRRCVSKQAEGSCVYHPAPMTKKRPVPDRSRPPMPKIISKVTSHVARPAQPPSAPVPILPNSELNRPSSSSPLSSLVTGTMTPARTPENTNQYGRVTETEDSFARTARYYGPTSYASVFTESDLLEGIDHRIHFLPSRLRQPLLRADMSSTLSVQKNQIITALSNIPSQDICESFVGSKSESHYHITLNIVLIKHAVAGLWSTFGELLSFPRTAEKLEPIAEMLCKNETPLPPAPDDGMEWLRAHIGSNLRVEMLGLLFCFFGMAYQSLLDGDYRLSVPENQGWDRKQLSWRMKECADICLKMV